MVWRVSRFRKVWMTLKKKFDFLPDVPRSLRRRGATPDLAMIVRKLDLLERQNRMLIRHLLVPHESEWRGHPLLRGDTAPAPFVFDRSVLCKAESFREPYFSYWTTALGENLRYHRKLWEFVFICQALHERGLLNDGSRGLGFGVGKEPLSAYFAGRGCQVVATDMAADHAAQVGWTKTAEHAAGKASLARPELCPPDQFDRNVTFRTVDMNAVPEDLVGFDYCWSACALEHLGSIEHGLAYIERSVATLKPGGYAVHTTEFNVSSDDDTVDGLGTVLFRKRDFLALTRRLEAQGHSLTPFDFDPGFEPLDRYVDVAPYMDEPHLKTAINGYATTSIGLVVRRGETSPATVAVGDLTP